jgi:CheY-like chemotaxis protein
VTDSILIVDDNSDIREMIREVLETRTGFVVCGEASDGMDAITKAGELRPSLIILDFSMPRMNGFEAARVLRSMMGDVVIILFTCFADMISFSDAAAAGVNAVVSKDDLVGLIRYVQELLPARFVADLTIITPN